MGWGNTNYIEFTNPASPSVCTLAVQEREDEEYDEDVDATGHAMGRGKSGQGKGKGRSTGETAVKCEFFGKHE